MGGTLHVDPCCTDHQLSRSVCGYDCIHIFKSQPRAIAERQSPQTKRMMAMRQQPAASIFSEEVRIDGPDAGKRGSAMTAGPVIQMGNYNAANPAVEDDLGAGTRKSACQCSRHCPAASARARCSRPSAHSSTRYFMSSLHWNCASVISVRTKLKRAIRIHGWGGSGRSLRMRRDRLRSDGASGRA